MPMLTPEAIIDPETVARPVFAVGMDLENGGFDLPLHSHPKAELIFTARGLLTCEVAKGLWMVPPQCALWIPCGMEHGTKAIGTLEAYALFVDPAFTSGMPKECCTVSVDLLMRELVMAIARLPTLYDHESADGRLVQTMLDRLKVAPIEQLHLPLPADGRLRRIAEALAADPSDRATIGQWASRIAMSERTLSRSILRETGMSFGRWRQQFQILLALERLASGDPVQSVAFDLGYESVSAFITMFKKALGQPPRKYLASRMVQARSYPGTGRRSHKNRGDADVQRLAKL